MSKLKLDNYLHLAYNYRMRNLRALALLLYSVALFVIPLYHITEIPETVSDCFACLAVKTDINETAVAEPCTPEHPCHNSNHPHHNHPTHEHDCQICQSVHSFVQSPLPDNSIGLDLSCAAFLPFGNEILFNAQVIQSIDIRGPPTL